MDTLVIGIIQRSHGLKGFIRVKSLSGELEHFRMLETIHLKKGEQSLPFEVEGVQISGKTILLKLKGINSSEQVLPYIQWEILAPRKKASPLKNNEFYYADLCRCRLFYKETCMGQVVSVVEAATSYLLEVLLPSGKKVFVPFVEAHIGEIDIEAGRIELRNEWILE
ncbi:MAG: ribosome maturation factor RimM [Spirochaetales bacterium]